jgi:teichuronic acid exporter
MDRALLHGLAWTAGARWLAQVFSWCSTILVAKLLTPADYGVVGMSVLLISFIALINGFGVVTAVVTLRDLTDDDLHRLNAFAVLFGVACFLVGVILAVPIGAYFRSPAVPLIVVIQSAGFILSGIQSVPTARLQRELAFKRLATIDLVRSVVSAVAALGLALWGARYWTLVGAELIGAATQAVITTRARPTAFLWRELGRVRRAIVFGGRTVIGRICWYVFSNADFVVAGRMLGPTLLGSYSFAWTLVSLPVEKITSLLGRVTPSFLVANRDDRGAMQRYVLGITEALAVVTLPATAGIALVAPDLIPLVFGAQWQRAVAPLQILALCMGLRSIVPVMTNAMVALEDMRFMMWHGVFMAICFPICFYAGARLGGIDGIALVWLIVYPVSLIPLFWRAVHIRAFAARAYVSALAPAVVSTLVMTAVVLGVRVLLRQGATPPRSALWGVAEIVMGALTYGLVLLLRYRERVRAALAFVRSGRGAMPDELTPPAPVATRA